MKLRPFKRIDPNTLILIKQISLGVLLLSGCALLLTGIWHGTRMSAFTLDNITVAGGETVDHERVHSIVVRELEGQYVGFVPRRFTYTYPKQSITEAVSSIERVHTVLVERVDRKTIHVSIQEYEPQALWCETVDSSLCVFLGHDGYAFATAPNLRGGSFQRFVHLTEQPEIGRTIVDATAFATALELSALFEENEWYISHIELDQVGDAFLHIVDGGELKVALSTPPAETVENLFVVLTSDEFQHIEPGNFSYIDLRFGSKVFVKEEETAPAPIGEGAATSSASSTNLE